MIKLTLTKAEKEAQDRILNSIKKKMDQETIKFDSEIKKKTSYYVLWSIGGILLIIIPLPKVLSFIFSFAMIWFMIHLLRDFLRLLKKVLPFINDFDQEIKKLVEKEIRVVKEDSLKTKLGLMLSGLNQKDIEDLSISYFVRELIHRLKKYKKAILVRIIAYIVAVLLFREVLFSLLI